MDVSQALEGPAVRAVRGDRVTTKTTQPNPAPITLAERIYNAYGGEREWKAFAGTPMPAWPDLPEDIKDGWRASAQAAENNFLSPMATESPLTPQQHAQLAGFMVAPLSLANVSQDHRDRFDRLRTYFVSTARTALATLPPGRATALVITNLEQAWLWACQALHGASVG
jgi:hypothetical protein